MRVLMVNFRPIAKSIIGLSAELLPESTGPPEPAWAGSSTAAKGELAGDCKRQKANPNKPLTIKAVIPQLTKVYP